MCAKHQLVKKMWLDSVNVRFILDMSATSIILKHAKDGYALEHISIELMSIALAKHCRLDDVQ